MNNKIKSAIGLLFIFLMGCSNHQVSNETIVAQQNNRAITELNSLGVDAEQFEKGVIIYLPPDINFEESKADIKLKARSKIAEISRELNKEYLADRYIEVAGHTNSNGDADVNLEISRKRAEAAAEELVFSNVSLTRLTITWHGEEKPRFPEFNADGSVIVENLELNRRVEFIILNPGID